LDESVRGCMGVSHLQVILSDERRSAILQVNISHPVPFVLGLAKTGNPDHLRSKFWSRRHSTCQLLNALEKSLNPGREDVIDGPPSESGQCLGEAVALGRESRLRLHPHPIFRVQRSRDPGIPWTRHKAGSGAGVSWRFKYFVASAGALLIPFQFLPPTADGVDNNIPEYSSNIEESAKRFWVEISAGPLATLGRMAMQLLLPPVSDNGRCLLYIVRFIHVSVAQCPSIGARISCTYLLPSLRRLVLCSSTANSPVLTKADLPILLFSKFQLTWFVVHKGI
jgi:hypothetical protein